MPIYADRDYCGCGVYVFFDARSTYDDGKFYLGGVPNECMAIVNCRGNVGGRAY